MQRIAKYIIVLLLILQSYSSSAQINRQYVYYVGQELIVEEKYKSAIDVLNVLLRADTASVDAYFLRGIAKYNLGDLIGADKDFSLAIELNSVFTMAYHYRAITRSFIGNYDDALTDFDKAIDIRPDQDGVYYSRGVTYFLSQQFEKAIQDFNHFLRRKPNSVDAYVNRGTCYLMLKDTTNAFNNYDRAAKINYYDPTGFLRRGMLYLQMQEYDKAYEDLTKSISLDSTSVPAYFNRALVHASSNRPMNAIADFSKIILLDSTNSLTYFNRALLRTKIGDYNKAMDDYNKVAFYSPGNVLVYFNRGLLNDQLGNIEDAELDFTKAIELYPDFANAYLSRSGIKYKMGDMQGSKSDHDIANKKIQEYKMKLSDSTFSSYADTSKMFNSLLSFDVDFGNKEFENVNNTNLDVKIEPMYRYTSATEPDAILQKAMYRTNSLDKQKAALKDYGLLLASLKEQHSDETLKELNSNLSKRLLKDSENEVLNFAKGAVDHALKQYTNAIKHYNKVIQKSPDNPFYYMSRAVANAEMTEFVAKIDNKNHKLIIDADPVNQLKNTQKTYSYDVALRDINYALMLDANVAQFYYNRGNILYLSGDLVGAINSYTKAIELDSSMADAYFNRGIIQVKLKETKKGFLDISRSGELGNSNAYELLKRYGKLLNK